MWETHASAANYAIPSVRRNVLISRKNQWKSIKPDVSAAANALKSVQSRPLKEDKNQLLSHQEGADSSFLRYFDGASPNSFRKILEKAS